MDEVPNELGGFDKQKIRFKKTQSSWVTSIQDKIIYQNQLLISKADQEDKQETNIGIITGKQENEPLFDSRKGSSVYFREDSRKSNVSDFDPTLSRYRTQPHEVHFRIKPFFKYLCIRLLYSIFGPLILIIGICDKNWLVFMSNLRFTGCYKATFLNYFKWLLNYSMLITFIYYIKTGRLYQVYYELIFYITFFLTDNVTTATKYAFFHYSKLNLIEQYQGSIIGDCCQLNLDPFSWGKQTDCIITKELDQSTKRYQVELTHFQLFFMVSPKPEMFQKIRTYAENVENRKLHYEHTGADGILMAKEIINRFNSQCLISKCIKISIIVSILRIIIYILICYYFDIQQKGYEIKIQIVLLQFLYFFMIMVLMMATYRDLRRKVYALSQLSHLISAEKVEHYQESKLFPTLNLLCVCSLFSWFNLRKILLDYGLAYMRRQSFMMSFIMIINACMMITSFFLYYLKYLNDIGLVQATIDFAILAIISIFLVLQGARINEHWCVHKGLLRKNLFLIQQLIYYVFKTPDYTFTPQDPVYAALITIIELMRTQGGALNADYAQNYVMFAINSIQNCYDDLNHLEKQQPYTVMGIAMTYELLLQLCLSVVGLIGTAALNFILTFTK